MAREGHLYAAKLAEQAERCAVGLQRAAISVLLGHTHVHGAPSFHSSSFPCQRSSARARSKSSATKQGA